MAGGHLEVERKYDVDDGFVLPDPTGLAGTLDGSPTGVVAVDTPVEHRLSAVYVDTPDLRLTRARITLRRRTGGTDEGWHLKLPAGSERRELHAPLGRAAARPPKALLDPVRGILRGTAPGPVATLQTHRVVTALRGEDGQVLAELADDTVTATVPATEPGEPAEVTAWREIEVELVTGDERLLTAAGTWLVAAGARPSPAASKVGRVLAGRLGTTADARPTTGKKARAGDVVLAAVRDQVAALQQADVGLRTGRPGAVHQIRIATRRLRSILAAFRTVLDRATTDPLRAELAWLAGELGRARDDEVALAHLRELAAAQPAELVLGPVAARLQQTQLRAEEEGLRRARATLAGRRYLRLLDDLHALLADPPLAEDATRPARPVLRAATARAGRRFRRRVRAARRAGPEEREEALHEVRRAAKRVRYTAEVGRAQLGRAARQPVRWSKRVQTSLGALQDTVVTRERCRRLGIEATAAGEPAFTYGRLHALEEARADRALAAFEQLEPELGRALRAATR